jgi:hypothetical protein
VLYAVKYVTTCNSQIHGTVIRGLEGFLRGSETENELPVVPCVVRSNPGTRGCFKQGFLPSRRGSGSIFPTLQESWDEVDMVRDAGDLLKREFTPLWPLERCLGGGIGQKPGLVAAKEGLELDSGQLHAWRREWAGSRSGEGWPHPLSSTEDLLTGSTSI